MTQLPATLVEAEALTMAKVLVHWLMDKQDALSFTGRLKGLELSAGPLHPEAGRMLLRHFIQHDAMISDSMFLELMHVAEDAGDNDVIAALDEIAFATLNRSNEIPAFVRTYLAKKAAGHIRPRGGSSAATNYLRDICIMVVLLQLVETFGPALKFTRAPYERRSRPRSIPRAPSACSIARQALFEADVFVGDEAALNKIVLRFKSSGRLHREGSVWKLHSAIKLRSVRKVPSQHLSNH